jgi:hypothetical protein
VHLHLLQALQVISVKETTHEIVSPSSGSGRPLSCCAPAPPPDPAGKHSVLKGQLMRLFPLLQGLVDLFLAVHLHLLQALQVITVLKRRHTRLFPLLQDLTDLFLAVHLHLLQTLQVSSVKETAHEIFYPSSGSDRPPSCCAPAPPPDPAGKQCVKGTAHEIVFLFSRI